MYMYQAAVFQLSGVRNAKVLTIILDIFKERFHRLIVHKTQSSVFPSVLNFNNVFQMGQLMRKNEFHMDLTHTLATQTYQRMGTNRSFLHMLFYTNTIIKAYASCCGILDIYIIAHFFMARRCCILTLVQDQL